MKSQKNKQKVSKSIWKKYKIIFAGILLGIFWYVFAEDVISEIIPSNTATSPWSNNSYIQTWAGNSQAQYINKGNNSTVIGNYFKGYYYDSVYGFFRLDEPTLQPSERVRVVSSTGKCPSWYGYKLWWYAYSSVWGVIDFDYNNNIFVYYCESDKKLHGYGYNENIGFQSFEWIGFEIIPNITTNNVTTGTGFFVNDITSIDDIVTYSWATSNYDYNTIGWDVIELDATQESIFYIVK